MQKPPGHLCSHSGFFCLMDVSSYALGFCKWVVPILKTLDLTRNQNSKRPCHSTGHVPLGPEEMNVSNLKRKETFNCDKDFRNYYCCPFYFT